VGHTEREVEMDMNERKVKEVRANGLLLTIWVDEDPGNPRDYQGIGHMHCFHGRHQIGDEHGYRDPKHLLVDILGQVAPEVDPYSMSTGELQEAVEKTGRVVMLPIYLLDHPGLRVSTKSFNDPGDSGRVDWVGWIWALVEGGNPVQTKERLEQILQEEVECYDAWLAGEVYSYSLVRESDGEEIDSCDGCWGFESVKAGLELEGFVGLDDLFKQF